MRRIHVKCADGEVRELMMVSDLGNTVMACSVQRFESTPKDELDDYLVGFPKRDVVSFGEELVV